jgi:hypothetical protein
MNVHAPELCLRCTLGLERAPRALLTPCITATNRMHLVLIGMQNRAFVPYLAAINRIRISVMVGMQQRLGVPRVGQLASREHMRIDNLVVGAPEEHAVEAVQSRECGLRR